jgi:hypothetical protein
MDLQPTLLLSLYTLIVASRQESSDRFRPAFVKRRAKVTNAALDPICRFSSGFNSASEKMDLSALRA